VRVFSLVILISCLGGCAAKPQAQTPPLREYEPALASALVLDPAIPSAPAIDLARASRQAEAFVGYDSLISTYSYLRIDDRQRSDGDRYERRSIIQSVSVRER